MHPDDLITNYVDDVARLLPRGQRRDVAFELRTLLADELAARAADAGRDADEEMARDLVLGFGRPAEVAARYRPALTLIDPADTRRFIRLAVVGVAVIWLLGLVDALVAQPVRSAWDVLSVLGAWWTGIGVPALWWPGLLVVCFALVAWQRRRRPEMPVWKPRRQDRDGINRIGFAAGIAAAVCGLLVLLNPGTLLDYVYDGRAAASAYQAFAFDEDFFRQRAPWLLALIILHLALYAVLIVRGRWQPLTRRIDIGLTVVVCGALTWVLLAGDIYTARPTDQLVKALIVLIVLGSLVDAGVKLRRELRHATYLPST
ncbi:hypothetical protein Aple_068780 [Acrocarpospora pleiomorpha]|uniref:Uncharacterized protein n=1 Tax=Acrocarpospora pleiomorpha TaxID=90975 RepID=A0A5M3XVB4_9ACTN|nr:hypothetical protein [Acrocarpospora pleiomorpha]GES23979.1 hypothetical protein Aple_068780 [Acrocarpospora pleiomorpha]